MKELADLIKNRKDKNCVKIVIWEDYQGRQVKIPEPDTTLYYNPKGGKNYHSSPECLLVREKYRPLQAFTWGELDEEPYSRLTPCPGCAPQIRREGIDTVNEKNTRK
jgi:hypothetical protein